LTGKFAHGTGVWGNGLPNDPPLSGGHAAFVANGNESQTLAAALDPAGYRTALIGKYLNGYYDADGVPFGWDEFKAYSGKPKYYDYTLGGVQYGTGVADYSTDVIAQLSVEAINSTQSEPLFLYIAPFAPHFPFTPAPRHEDVAVGQLIHSRDFGAINEANISDKPQYIQQLRSANEERMREVARLQHRAVMGIDDLTADVVDALRDKGMLGDTMVIYASDNGILWGEHRWTGKNVPYWRATEVPLFIRWDGHLPQGTVDDRLALNVDVTATIAEAAGVDMPWSEGRSLVSGAGRLGFVLEAIASYPPFATRPAYCGWRSPNRLYVRYATGEEELYLYRNDPLEKHNVATESAYASRVASMRANAVKACNPTPPDFTWNP
jgi:arylsulfatase A-like enzyme